jgi:6-pyruvoyltetrahydropterin/6-carboxytetrahydropterin synthase
LSLIRVTKEFVFDSAHRIPDHPGKCKNIHGHTYRVQVTVGLPLCEFKQSVGMVMDFGDLSQAVKPVIEAMDHAIIVSDKDKHLLSILPEEQKRLVMHGPPTAENMAIDIGMNMQDFLKERCPEVILCTVRVWETPTSFAEYDPEGGNPCQTCKSSQ